MMEIDPSSKYKKADSRRIAQRIVVTGTLTLESPTQLGNGDAEALTDLPLLLDYSDTLPVPLLQGSSIAGALRAYVQARQHGYFRSEPDSAGDAGLSTAERKRNWSAQSKHTHDAIVLFGGAKGDEYGDQSPLIVDDALGALPPEGAEVRDGVRIDGAARTAEDKFKYDLELLPAGTTFPLRFELLVGEDDAPRLMGALALALQAFEQGAITLGARKSRGFGRCRVPEWAVTRYNLLEREGLLAWLAADHPEWGYAAPKPTVGPVAEALAAPLASPDKRTTFTIVADFALASTLLIRSEEPLGEGENQPDFIHLRNSKRQPIVPGTSAAGALRARATRIVNTLELTSALDLVDSLFGKDMQRDPHNPTASRLVVEESEITDSATLVQNRVAIDRFTGGAFDTALFAEAPAVGGEVRLTLAIRDHPDLKPTQRNAEKGLLLLLLRDLWTGDLALGGTSNIGRGRLRGLNATITDLRGSEQPETWTIKQGDEGLTVYGEQQALENLVKALHGGA